MDQKILDLVLQDSLTLHQAYKYLRILKEYLSSNIFGSEHQNILQEDQEWLSKVDKDILGYFNKNNLITEFEKILSELEKIPVLVIYFAFEPDNTLIKNISTWLKTNYQERIVLDSKIDPNLIAGCSMVWNGVYKDYSLRGKIEQDRQEILTYLSQSIHKT